jgi:hypothetical protein
VWAITKIEAHNEQIGKDDLRIMRLEEQIAVFKRMSESVEYIKHQTEINVLQQHDAAKQRTE